MSKGYFITGTDTEIGKTTIAVALIHALQNSGRTVSAMKPIASGSEVLNGELRNDDALKLIEACKQPLDYKQVNPYTYAPPIAPHIAAEQTGQTINIANICQLAEKHKQNSDYLIVEGVGGWQVPLNDQQTIEDLAIALKLPVILVVGIRLGCINHALLTATAIEDSGLQLAGWIANQCDQQTNNVEKIIASLQKRISAKCLAIVDYMDPVDAAVLSNKIKL